MRPRWRGRFPAPVREAVNWAAEVSGPAFIEVMGARPFVRDLHAMTHREIAGDSQADGGAGYMIQDESTGAIRIAINPTLSPRRAVEVWIEEQVHALDPELEEPPVRNILVPAIARRIGL